MTIRSLFNHNSGGLLKPFRVCIRRHVGLKVKPEAEQIDDRVFIFRFGWVIEDDDSRYPGEEAWIPTDASYPVSGPAWVASGDLKPEVIGEKHE